MGRVLDGDGVTESRPDSTSPDPRMCLWAGPAVVGDNQFCKLARAWCNCLAAGCFVTPEGRHCAIDNGPEACARRLRAMKEES